MKAVGQNYKSGDVRLLEIEMPALKPGGVLVRTIYSVISAGTEGMKVREGKLSYLGLAMSRPDQVKKVMATVRQQGIKAAYQKVMNKLDSLTPLGYSLAGEVIAVGEGAEEFHVGQKVACAGAGYANHAEINFVPRQLVVPIPEGVDLKHAAFTTIGAIAMQGFRQSDIKLGETACVVGLGLIGQMLVQLLSAAGVRVIGLDLLEDRCALAASSGAAWTGSPQDPALAATVKRITSGIGADCIFLCAATENAGPAEVAAKVARDRARVVDIGKTRLDLPWKDYYEKEMELRFSRSYGPGRYDRSYEEQGVDYPVGHVRWTERRNMAAFLDLVAAGKMKLDSITSAIHPFDEAESIFEEMAEGQSRGLGVIFEYRQAEGERLDVKTSKETVPVTGKVRLGVIGAGNYAGSMLMPHLVSNPDVQLVEVVTSTGLTAKNAKDKFGFARAGSDAAALISSSDIDAVLIATRHSSHADLVARALRAGKAVFVEKPLAIDRNGINLIKKAMAESGNNRLMVGFNRRFAASVVKMAKVMESSCPVVINYRVHAGQLDGAGWYGDPGEGSRFIGEAGHFLDLFALFTGSSPASVTASCIRNTKSLYDDSENIVATVTYANGSIGNLLYLTQGSAMLPKEYIEVVGGGRTVQLHNFELLKVYEGNRTREMRVGGRDKGQADEMRAFIDAVKSGSEMPFDYNALVDTTLLTLAVPESLRSGLPVIVEDFRRGKAEVRS